MKDFFVDNARESLNNELVSIVQSNYMKLQQELANIKPCDYAILSS
jgi:hypothetical protein